MTRRGFSIPSFTVPRVTVVLAPPWRWRLGYDRMYPTSVNWPRLRLGPVVILAMPLRPLDYMRRRGRG